MNLEQSIREIDRFGVAIIPAVFDREWIVGWIAKLGSALRQSTAGIGADAVKSRNGVIYAARNILTDLPGADSAWKTPVLEELLRQVLGPDFVLVRTLFFDKHPQRTWSLPWHKDMTIAVRDHSLPTTVFSKRTVKSGVPHVEASTDLLENMLTLRIHLDDVTEENGPLEIIPGSHKNGKQPDVCEASSRKILVNAGDVLAMRPLISHASGSSTVGTHRHRRVLHFEFSGDRVLPDGYEWYYPVHLASGIKRQVFRPVADENLP